MSHTKTLLLTGLLMAQPLCAATLADWTFTGDITGSSIVLRFTASNSTGNMHINDIQVTGTIVPEPSGSLLLGLGGLVLTLRRRR